MEEKFKEENMEEKNVIAVIGRERADILYFLCQVGKKAKKKILVIDNSYINDYFYSFEIEDGLLVYEYLTVCKNFVIPEEQYIDYDYIFVYAGMNLNGLKDYNFNACITSIWDNALENGRINILREYLEEKNPEIQHAVIIRDVISNKISQESLLNETGINPNWLADMNLDVADTALYNSLLRNKKASLKKAGAEMQQTVAGLAEAIFGISKKEINKLISEK